MAPTLGVAPSSSPRRLLAAALSLVVLMFTSCRSDPAHPAELDDGVPPSVGASEAGPRTSLSLELLGAASQDAGAPTPHLAAIDIALPQRFRELEAFAADLRISAVTPGAAAAGLPLPVGVERAVASPAQWDGRVLTVNVYPHANDLGLNLFLSPVQDGGWEGTWEYITIAGPVGGGPVRTRGVGQSPGSERR